MKRRNIFAVWIGLPLITLGIYHFVWYYKIHREMAEFDRRRTVPTTGALLTILFGWILIVPPFVSYFNTGNRIRDKQIAAGLAPTCSAWLGLLLVFVLGLQSLYYQAELNKVIDHYAPADTGTQVPLAQ
jgi:hypothetical protein